MKNPRRIVILGINIIDIFKNTTTQSLNGDPPPKLHFHIRPNISDLISEKKA